MLTDQPISKSAWLEKQSGVIGVWRSSSSTDVTFKILYEWDGEEWDGVLKGKVLRRALAPRQTSLL